MLNLQPVFHDALTSLTEGGEFLASPPLAACVYMMQRDVLNQYRYALEHYLTVDLAAPFLQNSSLGSPHQKWGKFTNDDFALLSFHIKNLVRYTARLVDQTLATLHQSRGEFRKSKAVCNNYIPFIVETADAQSFLGIRCEETPTVRVISLSKEITPTSRSTEETIFSWKDEVERCRVLNELLRSGTTEVATLSQVHEMYALACIKYFENHPVISGFEELHPSYCA